MCVATSTLGADAQIELMSEADYKTVAELLDKAGFSYKPKEFKRVASAKQLYHWNADANQSNGTQTLQYQQQRNLNYAFKHEPPSTNQSIEESWADRAHHLTTFKTPLHTVSTKFVVSVQTQAAPF